MELVYTSAPIWSYARPTNQQTDMGVYREVALPITFYFTVWLCEGNIIFCFDPINNNHHDLFQVDIVKHVLTNTKT